MKQIELKAIDTTMTNVKTLVVGTRGSKLALWQTGWLIDKIRANRPNVVVETRIFTTQGDKIQDVPLQSVGDDGFFVRELETALLNGEIDLAIHSLKDLPTRQPEGLVVPATPEREDARDALLSKHNLKLADLPQGAVIGTSSVRRASQLRAFRPDFQLRDLRGNVDTRIRKLHEQDYDAIILATAGVSRISRADEITERISFKYMLPAPGQGALAPECRADDRAVMGMLAQLNNREAQAAVEAERQFMQALGGGCQTPVGAFSEVVMRKLTLRAYIGAPDGSRVVKVEAVEDWEGTLAQSREMANRLAEEALKQGAREILDDARANGYITDRK